ncbi:MAG: ATP-dependent helicase [Clostridium sp.]|nr:ATP-dependent helicase [Clostridium sp.]
MLNTAQKQAVNCDAEKILCLAGAGTGKTHCVISRINRLIEDGADISSILVLTFTNAAACEMRERFRRTHKGQTIPMFCTFHSYCYSLISRNSAVARNLGYYKDTPAIADDMTIRKIHTRCRQQCGTKISDDKLNGKMPLKPNEKFQYDIFWKQYDKLLREENYITFDIMCYGVSKLFSDNNPVADPEKLRFKYVFVDEFQDTDPKQWEFVSSFTNSNIFVCGDAKQAIYSFRGADISIIKSLAENPEWVTIKLSENYRSTKEICDYSNEIHKSWKGSAYDLDILSDRIGVQVIERGALDIHNNKDILNIVSDSADGKSTAILCRTNYEATEIKDKLEQLNIPFNSKHTDTDVSGILKSAVDSHFCVDWLSNKLSANEYNNYIRYCSIDSGYSTEVGFMELYHHSLESYIKIIMQVREVLHREQFVYGKITAISELLNIPQGTIKLESDDDNGVIDYLIQLADSLSKETGIYVGTIHSVKGLEYDCVHLVGVNGKSFPVNKNEEQQNLFYVGCTRAKEKLVIYDSELNV